MRLADILTASRILATPIVIWLIVADERLAAYYLFAAAAITDHLDGYFARRSKKIATYGDTFDGLADFFLIFGTLIILFIEGDLGFWVVVVTLIAVAFITPVVIMVSRQRGRFTLPHENMNIVAAAVYPAIMAYIIGWEYAWVLLLVVFLVGTPVAINNTISTIRAGR
ncbi:MAG: CDP-alcohol phosphatidyltransferase family protein [Dehalococcoidia bacterium]|nr:MAG: CDP-alcohol phosphatidyltransferase family protein [Dehalococcoidia bacterium]